MANTIDRVKQNIRERLEELEAERDQLMRALEALSDSPSSVGGRRGRPPGSGAGRKSATGKRAAGRRAPRGQRREQLIAALAGAERGPSEIAREIGDINPTQVSGMLRKLASEGVVARTAEGKWRLTAAADRPPTGDSPAQGSTDESAPDQPAVAY